MTDQIWDSRYDRDEFVYGKEPNGFLFECTHLLKKGNVLLLGEGEGRNAVYLARQGFDVTAIDYSRVALEKARSLASEFDVAVNWIHADLMSYDLGVNHWDNIISIFVPHNRDERRRISMRIISSLKPSGICLCETYSPDQAERNTGGGNDPTTMATAEMFQSDFAQMEQLRLRQFERNIVEGLFHTGQSSVVQYIGRKPQESQETNPEY